MLKSIGVVVEGLPKEGARPASRYLYISRIRIFDEYAEGLRGLEDYSHIFVIYYLHEVKEAELVVRPWGRGPAVGIFATRFPPRPNPIGVAAVELVAVRGAELLVRGLDAWTGTPVLDVKPLDFYDVVKSPRIPEWAREEWCRHKAERKYHEVAPWLGPADDGCGGA